MRWSSEERAFTVESFFSNQLPVIATQRAFWNHLNVSPERPCSGPEINRYMGHYVQANRDYDTTKNWSTSAHQIIWEHWGTESFNLAFPTTFCAQTCLCSFTSQSFSDANTSRWPSLPSLQNDDCAGSLRTWRTVSTLDVSLPFVVKHDLKANIWE